VIQMLHQGRLVIVRIRDVVLRQSVMFVPAPNLIERAVAADEDEPGGWIPWRAMQGPALQGAEAGLLKGFFGHIQVTEIAQQRGNRLWPCRGERSANPADLGHCNPIPGQNVASGRTSSAPVSPTMRRAISSASCKDPQSTT